MSKCTAQIPLSMIDRLAIVQGNGRSLAQIKAANNCDLIMNGGFYSMTTGKPTHHLKVSGTVLARESWGCWGYAWDKGGDIALAALPAEDRANYIGAYELLTPMVGPGAKLQYGAELGGSRGRTAIALTKDSLILWCSGDGTRDAATPEELKAKLEGMGAESALMLDGGGSSQCDFGEAGKISSSRRVNNYICLWLRKVGGGSTPDKEDKMGKYRVTPTVGLNIRKGPGVLYAKVGSYPYGAEVTVTQEVMGWGKTDRGWVSMDYLESAGEDRVTGNGVTIHEDMIPSGQGARPGKKLKECRGLAIHWIGVAQGHADVIRKNFGRDQCGTHYISDWYTGEIIQCVPEDEMCYHVGSERYTAAKEALCGGDNPNGYLVGIECCIDPESKIPADYAARGKYMDLGKPSGVQYEALVKFAADFLERHGLTEESLYRHYDITGKACHAWFVKDEARWEKFKADVKKERTGESEKHWYDEARAWAMEQGITDGSRPMDNVTRAEVWQMLYNLEGKV